jgi:hypothetical protein
MHRVFEVPWRGAEGPIMDSRPMHYKGATTTCQDAGGVRGGNALE